MLLRINPPTDARTWLRGVVFLAVWTALGLLDSVHTYLSNAYRGTPVGWGRALALCLSLWYAWGLLSLPVFAYVRRLPFTRGNWWHRLPLALLFAVALALVKIVLDYPIIETLYCPAPGLMPLGGFYAMAFARHFHYYVAISVGMLGVIHAWSYFREHYRRELKTWQLEARLAQAQLQALRMQLHPHFLFNVLHTIASLIHRDPDEAERVLARLGELLRNMLDTACEQEVPLRKELDFLRAYLAIEQARFGPRLEVRLDVDPDLLAARVPPFILQPIVENAIRHGVALASQTDRAGLVEVRARRASDRLCLEVWNDGPAVVAAAAPVGRKSIGLANTRARLEQLYGAAARLDLRNEPLGVLASMELPLNAPAEAPASDADTQTLDTVPLAGSEV